MVVYKYFFPMLKSITNFKGHCGVRAGKRCFFEKSRRDILIGQIAIKVSMKAPS